MWRSLFAAYLKLTSRKQLRMRISLIKQGKLSSAPQVQHELKYNRPFAAKPSRDLLFIELWAIA